jgi:CheY-like chemotaxis protein
VLDLSRVEAGRTELDNRLFHPRSVVREAMEMIRPQADKKGLRLSCNISPAVPATAEADEAKIIQVLTNLAGNAVKFTKEGEIEFSADIDETCEGRLVFSVRDTGVGIPYEKQSSVFKAFEQVEGGLTKEHEGTGLGLAISSRLVELMGGEISLQSGPGKGSTFTFKIPLQASSKKVEMSEDLGGGHVPAPGTETRPTVLVIDSDDKDRQNIMELLTQMGANAVEQADPEEGLLSAQFYEPRAVVLGGWREEGPAAALLEELRADPIAGDVPVIAATYAVPHHMPEGSGPDARIQKPVQAGCLAKALREAGIETGTTEEELPCNKDSSETKADMASRSLVLLVEDNPTNRQFVKEALKVKQWQVMEAENGKQCLEILEHTRPDLILMDLAMPVMDGLEATRKIRQDGRFQDIPVVALTAAAMEGDREKCLEAGCNDYVAKPVKIETLLSVMEKSLAREGELK